MQYVGKMERPFLLAAGGARLLPGQAGQADQSKQIKQGKQVILAAEAGSRRCGQVVSAGARI